VSDKVVFARVMSYAEYTKLEKKKLLSLEKEYFFVWLHEYPDKMILILKKDLERI
jgi:hypothetical protein